MTQNFLFLILMCLLLCRPVAAEQLADSPLSIVIFDGAQPELSVAVIDGELYQLGDLYEDSQILEFSSRAVILKNIQTSESVKCPLFESKPDAAAHRRALHFFIYKQMKAIYEAQVAYRHRFGDVYAPNMDDLVEQGLLRGFTNGIKEGYYFRVTGVGQTRRLAMFPREATFKAVAEPLETGKEFYYFHVDQLGEVRYSETRMGAEWGPVWEYNDPVTTPIKKIIRDIG